MIVTLDSLTRQHPETAGVTPSAASAPEGESVCDQDDVPVLWATPVDGSRHAHADAIGSAPGGCSVSDCAPIRAGRGSFGTPQWIAQGIADPVAGSRDVTSPRGTPRGLGPAEVDVYKLGRVGSAIRGSVLRESG